jgi:hypothetical protein
MANKNTKNRKKTTYLEPFPREGPNDPRVPIDGTFTIISLVGFMISAMFTISGRFERAFAWAGENAGLTWGFTFTLFFLLMFIAAMASITPKGKEL